MWPYYKLNIENPFVKTLIQADWSLIKEDILKKDKVKVLVKN